MVGEEKGWVAAPPGTRKSTYEQPEVPGSGAVRRHGPERDPERRTRMTRPKDPVPYTGVQYVAIPEFQGIGTSVGQQIAAALSGQMSAADALAASQTLATRDMTRAGYIK